MVHTLDQDMRMGKHHPKLMIPVMCCDAVPIGAVSGRTSDSMGVCRVNVEDTALWVQRCTDITIASGMKIGELELDGGQR